MSPTRPELPQVWTVRDIIQWGREFFTNRGIDEARRTIELMVCAVLGTKRIELYTDHERPLSKDELAQLKAMIQRRVAREPLQYILGKADFYGSVFVVTPAVLIPRPETELIAERVSRYCAAKSEQQFVCLDIGTGSGCIPIAIIKHTTNTTWTGIDVSTEALSVASTNAEMLGASGRFQSQELDVLTSVPLGGPFDIITMNPPYIGSADLEECEVEVKDHEPTTALTDHADGRTFYHRLAEIMMQIIRPGGLVFLEIGAGQDRDVENIFQSRGHLTTTIPDLAGIPRLIIVEPGT
ncbi:MAG: peptide chain release factor N(5)-glutamine methyltransferase [Ignavibacteria bacterium]|jgi:release factor glutamine methyltransferase